MITLILAIAFVVVVAIAAYGLNSSARYEQWYETNDEWWEAFLDGKMEDINELLDFISDTEADWAADMVRERYAYNQLFASYEALQDEYLKLKSKQQHKCPSCHAYMAKDGICKNKRCKSHKQQQIDLDNLPETFDAETAGKAIEAGGYVYFKDTKIRLYYALSTKNNGSVGCWKIDTEPNDGYCFGSIGAFVSKYKDEIFHQVTPKFLKKQEADAQADGTVKDCLTVEADLIPNGCDAWAMQRMLDGDVVVSYNNDGDSITERYRNRIVDGELQYFSHLDSTWERCEEQDLSIWCDTENNEWEIYADHSELNAVETFDSAKAAEHMEHGKVIKHAYSNLYAWMQDNEIRSMYGDVTVETAKFLNDSCDTPRWINHWKEHKFTLAAPQDLTDAPFEGLDGVKEGDDVLFSDGVIRKVKLFIERMRVIRVLPPIFSDGVISDTFFIESGKHWYDKADTRAIRIATQLDKKLYGGEK